MHRILRSIALVGALAIAACTPVVTNPAGGTGAAPGATSQASSAATPAPSADASATIHVLDFKLDPATIKVTGSVLSLAVTNDGPTIHNVTIRQGTGPELFGTQDLKPGTSETLVHAIAPGTYILYCDLPGHESLGVIGTLIVTAP